jgi:hypothetical protein
MPRRIDQKNAAPPQRRRARRCARHSACPKQKRTPYAYEVDFVRLRPARAVTIRRSFTKRPLIAEAARQTSRARAKRKARDSITLAAGPRRAHVKINPCTARDRRGPKKLSTSATRLKTPIAPVPRVQSILLKNVYVVQGFEEIVKSLPQTRKEKDFLRFTEQYRNALELIRVEQ